MPNHWNVNGDLVIEGRAMFRRVGWLVNGGPNDGLMFAFISNEMKSVSHGSFSPVYIQIGE